jgi:putative hydrolase of the HAD superfamily
MSDRYVFLDFGGTLAQMPSVFEQPAQVWTRVCRQFGIDRSDALVEAALEKVDRELSPRIYHFVGRTNEFWHLYDVGIMDELGIREHRDELEVSLRRVFEDPSTVRLYPDTLTALADLRARGHRLGVISNYSDGLLKVLKHHDLDRFFDTITYSQEAGAEKPDPAVFNLALKRAGCRPREAIHVGDSLTADVEGARQSGLEAIWINRDGRPGVAGVLTVRSLAELPAEMDRLDQVRSR